MSDCGRSLLPYNTIPPACLTTPTHPTHIRTAFPQDKRLLDSRGVDIAPKSLLHLAGDDSLLKSIASSTAPGKKGANKFGLTSQMSQMQSMSMCVWWPDDVLGAGAGPFGGCFAFQTFFSHLPCFVSAGAALHRSQRRFFSLSTTAVSIRRRLDSPRKMGRPAC